jgi:hypothetical protein
MRARTANGKPDGLDTPLDGLPELLSATGLYDGDSVAAAVAEFAVEFPLFTDGADKRRFLYVPVGTTIETSVAGEFRYPVGTRAWKEFAFEGDRVETRFFVKVAEDRWLYGAYAWNDDDSDATLVPFGRNDVRGDYDIPAQDACWLCHRGAADGLLGPSAVQLSHAEGDPLAAFEARGFLTDADALRTDVPGTPVVRAALGYLHANCGSCHVPRHPLTIAAPIDFTVPPGLATVDDAPVYRTVLAPSSTTRPRTRSTAATISSCQATRTRARFSTA